MHTGLEDKAEHFFRGWLFRRTARGGVGLMVTMATHPILKDGCRPGSRLATSSAAKKHRVVTDAVHAEGQDRAVNPACWRYGYSPPSVAPSRD